MSVFLYIGQARLGSDKDPGQSVHGNDNYTVRWPATSTSFILRLLLAAGGTLLWVSTGTIAELVEMSVHEP